MALLDAVAPSRTWEVLTKACRRLFSAGGVPNDRNLINFYSDGGLLYKGLIPRRPDDKIGSCRSICPGRRE